MSDETKENENVNDEDLHLDVELKAFEASLAALRPRRDRLDDRRRALLGTGPFFGSDALLSDVPLAENMDLSPSEKSGTVPCDDSCLDPTGHEFVCVHCGRAAPANRRVGRWAWPTAFAAMTTVAVALLLILAIRPASPVSVAKVEKKDGAAVPTTPSVAQVPLSPTFSNQDSNSDRRWALRKMPPPPRRSDTGQLPYFELREQVFYYGLDSWKPRVSTAAAISAAPMPPILQPASQREQLNRLLKEIDHAG